jgi:hypothetical protein
MQTAVEWLESEMIKPSLSSGKRIIYFDTEQNIRDMKLNQLGI